MAEQSRDPDRKNGSAKNAQDTPEKDNTRAPLGAVKYRDRPSEDGKYGDGGSEPNTGSPTEAKPC